MSILIKKKGEWPIPKFAKAIVIMASSPNGLLKSWHSSLTAAEVRRSNLSIRDRANYYVCYKRADKELPGVEVWEDFGQVDGSGETRLP